MPKIIHITGDINTRQVYLDGKYLSPNKSQKIVNHSPDGFMWGYGGSGPAQLALALLLPFVKEYRIALENYQTFKAEVIATLPQTNFDVEVDIAPYITNHDR